MFDGLEPDFRGVLRDSFSDSDDKRPFQAADGARTQGDRTMFNRGGGPLTAPPVFLFNFQ